MKLRIARLGMALCALSAGGCISDGIPTPAFHASLHETCAPTDGPAMTLYLTEQPVATSTPERPYTSVSVYHTAAALAGKRFTISSGSLGIGVAQDCPAQGDCTSPPSVTVTFGDLHADSTIAVTYKVTRNGGQLVAGSTVAKIQPGHRICA